MKKVIVTMANGPTYKAILNETLPLMQKYAKRIGAELIVDVTTSEYFSVPHYKKLTVLKKALMDFDRALWVDCDILISEKAPDIFEEVPNGTLGAFNEAPWVPQRHSKDLLDWETITGNSLTEGVYYNTGVLVLEKKHSALFEMPTNLINHYGEQTHLNQRIKDLKYEVHKLNYHWNRMSCTHTPEAIMGDEPFCSYFIHFAGEGHKEGVEGFIKSIAEGWKIRNYQGERRIVVVCGNGMGNQIATTPIISKLISMYPDYKITIKTGHTDVFTHLKSENVEIVDEKTQLPYKFAIVRSTAFQEGVMYGVLTHPTDFHSIALLHGQLLNSEKNITVPLPKKNKHKLPPNTVIIHAGKSGWKSKEMPIEKWQEIVDGLKTNGFKVALIGNKIFERVSDVCSGKIWGCFKLNNVDFDLTDISFAHTCDVIRQGAFLLTNDSMPVHAAGAFDNWIGLITIVKKPELVFPFRSGKQDYKAIAWTGTPFWEVKKEFIALPPDEQFSWADMHPGMKWPEPKDIVKDIVKILKGAKS